MGRETIIGREVAVERAGIKVNTSFITAFILLLFFFSGGSALLYQVIWQRILGFLSGTDIYSATITIAAFMCGLGCGNMVGGAIADRLSQRSLVALFAMSEVVIALFGLGSKWFYYDYLYLTFPQLGNHVTLLAVTLFVSLLIPTFIMGMSLPLLSKSFARSISTASKTISNLYAINALGAAVGAILTAYLFIRYFGFETTLLFGAAFNILSAIGALALLPFLKQSKPAIAKSEDINQAPVSTQTEGRHSLSLPVWCLIYSCSGFVALSLEIIWFRLIGIVLKSSAFTFSILLGIFLLGLAMGTLAGARWVKKSRNPALHFFTLQGGVILYAVLSITLFVHSIDHIPALSFIWEYLGADLDVSSVNWDYITLIHFLVPIFFILPATFMMGMSFPFLQRIIHNDMNFIGRRVGWLQTSNIIGSMLGTIVTGLILLEYVGVSNSIKLMVGLGGVFIFLAIYRGGAIGNKRKKMIACSLLPVVSLLIILVVPSSATIWAKFHGTEAEKMIYSEGRSGVTVIKKEDKRFPFLVSSNGKGMSWIPYGGIHSVLGVLPVLMHPDPKKIAVIGLGSGDTVFAAGGRESTEEIYSIEIAKSQFKTLERFQEKWGYAAITSILEDQRYRHLFTDGRALIMRSPVQYDIIEIDPQDPFTAYSGNLYSYEFFSLMRKRLKPGGYAVTYWASERSKNAFIKAFPHVLHIRGVLIGSEEPVEFNKEGIIKHLMNPDIQAYYGKAGIDIYRLLYPALMQGAEVFAPSTTPLGDYNTDLFPKDEFMTRSN